MHVQFLCAETGNRLEVIREKDGPYHFFWGKEIQSGVGQAHPTGSILLHPPTPVLKPQG